MANLKDVFFEWSPARVIRTSIPPFNIPPPVRVTDLYILFICGRISMCTHIKYQLKFFVDRF